MALVSILFLYIGIGILAAIGTVSITQARFSPRGAQVFYALLLIPVAAIYLAFVRYYAASSALPVEIGHLLVLASLALLALRFPLLAVGGYFMHGGWDLLHEVITLRGSQSTLPLTPIPLAYGVFCAAYDWSIAVYLLRRRGKDSA